MKAWTASEDEMLRKHHATHSISELQKLLGRSERSIVGRRYRLKLARNVDLWSAAEIADLSRWYAERTSLPLCLEELSRVLGRHKSNVARKAREMGLTNKHRPKVLERKIRRPKFASDESRRAHQSAQAKERIAKHGHPRGALGMKHSASTKERLSQLMRDREANIDPKEKRRQMDKMLQTRIERHGTAGPVIKSSSAFSRCNGGRRADLDGMYFRSGWEANYARYLNWLKARGDIRDWAYEPKTFVFHGVTRGSLTYTPDFLVTENDGAEKYHEVKGWMTSQSRTKLKRMAKHYPEEIIILIDEPQYRSIEKMVSGIVPNWEFKKAKR